jgi:nucleoside-diphosphate-sugar epimerase
MLVALTGATGFIGQYLLRELPKRAHRVRALLRQPAAMPSNVTTAVIGDLRQPQSMATALEGVDAVIHCAGIAHTSGVPEADYRAVNTAGTVALARAAQTSGVRRFVFLSSIRAQCGATADTVQTEAVEPRPTEAYGQSKLAAERGLAEVDLDWVSLRPVLVYGPGGKANMAQLVKLARSPIPLPLEGIAARRSLLSLENLLAAIETVLAASKTLRRAYIVAEREALTVSQMIAAMRNGMGRKPNVFFFPPAALDALFRAAGRREAFERLSGSLIADASSLRSLGWTPVVDTTLGLQMLMGQIKAPQPNLLFGSAASVRQ